jgi:hypothetical protein
MYRRCLRNFKTTKIEKNRETIEALNKNQSETKNTLNREINKLRMKNDNIKEQVTYDMENLRKKE